MKHSPTYRFAVLFALLLSFSYTQPAHAIKCPWLSMERAKSFIAQVTGKTKMNEAGLPEINPVWWKYADNHDHIKVELPRGVKLEDATVPRLFYELAKKDPDHPVFADEMRGVKTRRDIAAGVMTFTPYMKAVNEKHVGIMLPASGTSTSVMLATQMAGKVPAVINPTVGVLDMMKAVEISGVKKIFTSRKYVDGIRESLPEDQRAGFDEMGKKYFTYLEDLAATPQFKARFIASQLRAKLPPSTWVEFHSRNVDPVSMVLFTSGSSGVPKGVEMLHQNQVVNAMDLTAVLPFEKNDSLLGFLPHFHSFGATATFALPLVSDVRVAYSPNPKNLKDVLEVAKRYKTSMMIGTNTFFKLMAMQMRNNGDFSFIKAGVFGAEPFDPRTDGLLKKMIGDHFKSRVGYGMTETGPAASVQDWYDPEAGTVGKPLPHVEAKIVQVQPDGSFKEAPKGEQGVLALRGPNIMRGYLGGVPHETAKIDGGKPFFLTGDVFSMTEKGNLVIHGRAAMDFWKIGGEMVTRLKLQEVLQKQLDPTSSDQKYVVMPDKRGDKPSNVLFTTDPNFKEDDLKKANDAVRAGGLGSVYTIKKIVKLDSFPVMGTGKADLKTLLKMANGENPTPAAPVAPTGGSSPELLSPTQATTGN